MEYGTIIAAVVEIPTVAMACLGLVLLAYICVYVYTCIYTHMYLCAYVCKFIYTYTYIHTRLDSWFCEFSCRRDGNSGPQGREGFGGVMGCRLLYGLSHTQQGKLP